MQFDCTRCEELLLDYAYGELDEVTAAAFRRHADSCARCGASLADVRVVREAFSMLPLETPSPTVDNRILAAADLRLNELDDKKRALQRDDSRSLLGKLFDVFRVVAVRPQYAMAMVLVLVVGIGLYVTPELRMEESAAPGVAPTLVGEGGSELAPLPPPPAAVEPERDADGVADRTTTAAPTPVASAEAQGALAEAPAPASPPAEVAAGPAPRSNRAAPARPEPAPLRRALEGAEGDLDGRMQGRDRADAPLVVAQAPARVVTRGGGGGGADEESGVRLGFAQAPREAERSRNADAQGLASGESQRREQPAQREARAYAPPPSPARQPSFAQAPAVAAPSAPPPSAGSLQQAQQQRQQGPAAPIDGGDAAAFERGMRAFRAGQYRAAIPDLQQAIARPGLTNEALASAYNAIARSFKQSGNCAEAARRYEELMTRFAAFRSNAEVNFEAAECYRLLGNNARADQLYRVAERSARYGEAARGKRALMDGARRAAPAFDAAEAAEPAEPAGASQAH